MPPGAVYPCFIYAECVKRLLQWALDENVITYRQISKSTKASKTFSRYTIIPEHAILLIAFVVNQNENITLVMIGIRHNYKLTEEPAHNACQTLI